MLEQRNKRLLILLVVLITATVATAFWVLPEDTSFDVDKNLFRKVDLKTIDRVQLSSPTDSINLTFKDGRWTVNSKYPADRAMIEVLFATLQQAEPRRPVAGSLKDSIATALEKNGVKVDLIADQLKEESFYAGGNDAKSQAFFKLAGDNVPYIMVIPGYRVYASGIFELNEDGWRDKHVFPFNWRSFRGLQASFADKRNDFRIAMQDDFFGVEGIGKTDTTKLNEFMDALLPLTANQFLKTDTLTQVFSGQEPLMALTVEDMVGRQYSLKLYPLPARKQFAGQINGTEWALFDAGRIEPVLRPKGFFAGK
jgi:hypothetical protein